MKANLYVEGSMCLKTGAAGWGAILKPEIGESRRSSGEVHRTFRGMITLMELSAVQLAVAHFAGARLIHRGMELNFALRSTAALAVLRWVFPDAPFSGEVHVEPPKRLGAHIKDAQCLYDLDEIVERLQLKVRLFHAGACYETGAASAAAREEMERARFLAAG